MSGGGGRAPCVRAGEEDEADMYFGPSTQEALCYFQASAGLAETGVCDADTWRALLGDEKFAWGPVPGAIGFEEANLEEDGGVGGGAGGGGGGGGGGGSMEVPQTAASAASSSSAVAVAAAAPPNAASQAAKEWSETVMALVAG